MDEPQPRLRLFGHHPELFTAGQAFYGPVLRAGAVPMRVKELLRLRIARLNECQL